MLTDITIGQFFPGNSLLHRLDPRVKILLTLAFVVAVFIPKNWFGLLAAGVFLVAAIACSGLPLRLITKSLKPILPVIVLTAALNVFYVSRGDVLWAWWILKVTSGGLVSAAFLALRIVCLIAGSSLLTYTTGPTTLTDALERLMKPLKLVKVPVHELAMMMTIALRFIPTLIEETDKIMSAQKARGADLESGGVFKRIKALVPILIPLFVSSFSRAYELATAMECRCYHGGDGRTRMKVLRLAFRDWAAMIVAAVLVAGMIVLNVFIPPVI
ncbi:MAG: energy-coupling factor transporter transmembrane protein EcfT [Clostridia bacterium]|nr:energy-coupling factor transporter transmembrane protein EcfT [Clostridia bacterium]